ncbi:MAG: hypothetical protein FJ095_17690 [Deltaproteobacteria bacterium]|nr:hypothetical protein [Deltaproteobacteria bacterium]
MQRRHLVALLALTLPTVACARSVDLGGSAQSPSVLMNYNGVRSGARRFPDYGSVDRSILARPR